jgi:cellulose synthase/poly-beta-1,6-N-acetylglucosamine synthase-like glycosyltransferase
MGPLQFSLVTTCRNEMRSLARWKQNILDQTRPPDEIVIVDAFSDDGTAEFLSEWAITDARLKVFLEKGAAAHGRNYAIEKAAFEYILSTDMGVRLSDNWCEELIAPFERDSSIEVVAGNTCIDLETVKTPAAKAEYYIENGGFPQLGPGHVPGNRSVGYMKRVWRELDGLPEDLTFYADDSVFGRQMLQAGYKIVYAPKAMTYWGRPQTLKQFWREQFNYGRGDGEADIKKPIVVKLWEKGMLPISLVPFLNGCRSMQKQKWGRAITSAIQSIDFHALVLMPVLTFGRGYWFARGYLVGMEGGVRADDCRQRLQPGFKE